MNSSNVHTMIIGLEDGYRGAPLEDQLRAARIEFERVPGVIATNLSGPASDYVDQGASRVFLRRRMTSGEIGCALAHRSAVRRFLDGPAEIAIIFEDDARLLDSLRCHDISNALSGDSPMVAMLHWNADWTVVKAKLDQQLADGRVLFLTETFPITATAYALNRSAAEILARDTGPVSNVADWPARLAHLVDFIAIYPWLAVGGESLSTSTLQVGRDRQNTSEVEKLAEKNRRLVGIFLHVQWLKHKATYGNYSTYWNFEIKRLIVNRAARISKRRIRPEDPLSPLIAPWSRLARLGQRQTR